MLPCGLLKITLVNLDVCSDPEHRHFEENEKSKYPTPAVAYAETVPTVVPQLRSLSFKRRTSVYVRDLPPPKLPDVNVPVQEQGEGEQLQEEEEAYTEEGGEPKRFKRAVANEGIAVSALALTTTMVPSKKTSYVLSETTTVKEMTEALDEMIVDALSFYAGLFKTRPSI